MVNPLNNLGAGIGLANQANDLAQAERRRAENLAIELARATSRRSKTDGDLQRERDSAVSRNNQLERTLVEKNTLILEWMHSNEAFKQLARQYGKRLGLSDQQRQIDFDEQILSTAEVAPEFSATQTLGRARSRLTKE